MARRLALAAGAKALQEVLNRMGSGRGRGPVMCSCGERMVSRGVRSKTVRTILGPLSLKRSVWVCPACGRRAAPLDERLDVAGTGFSPGAVRMMARAGSRAPFKEAAEDLAVYAELEVSDKDVQRAAEGVGRQIALWEQEERQESLKAARRPHAAASGKDAIPVLYAAFDGTGVPATARELEGRDRKSVV